MKIGEVARRANVATSRLRFYERESLLPAADRAGNGYRDYPESIVEIVRIIVVSQQLGFSLAEIRRFLPVDPEETISCDVVISQLTDKIKAINDHMDELAMLERRLMRMRSYFRM